MFAYLSEVGLWVCPMREVLDEDGVVVRDGEERLSPWPSTWGFKQRSWGDGEGRALEMLKINFVHLTVRGNTLTETIHPGQAP